jgi:DNA-binding SARP family transcriptional activator/tetratricopeptide (TPR) repeat protein
VTGTDVVSPADPLAIRLCGALRVSRGNSDVDLSKTARQGRLALAYLVLNRDRAVTREELMEHIWADPDPQRVAGSLTQTLSRLRKALGRETLERLPSGAVRLRGPLGVDIEDAQTTLREARDACRVGAWESVWQTSKQVLAETGGEVLAGDDAEWLEPVRRHVTDLRVEALELHATAALRMGAPGDAEEAARSAIETAETRESAWALLIEAQAARGDVALATETFHDFRARLREVYGLTPSRELIDLHSRVVEGGFAHEAPSRGAADGDGAVAFPPALTIESGEEAFIGRDDAMTRLLERYSLAVAARRQFVLLCGEPGIGKTRLASEFARHAHREGAIVLYGRSDAESLVPYQPFITAIEHYIAECGHGDFARELEFELRELGRLIPGLRRHMPTLLEPPHVEPELRRYRMFDAVSRVVAFVARNRPAVLILDDLHWADTSTALLVRHTVQQLHSVRLMIVGTFRDSEACRSDDLAELIASSRPERGFERISLSGFDPSETAAFVVARQGGDATDGFIRQLRYATDGNPFFMEETLKSLSEAELSGGDVVPERVLSDIEVPQRVNAVIAQRLLRLTDNTRQALAVASVVGADFRLALLEALIEQPAEQIISSLEEAEAAGLVREIKDDIDRFSFSHALVREVLREQQSDSRRRRRHQRIGEALEVIAETSAVNPAELAYHFFESRHSDRGAKAFRYSVEAGDRAAESLAHEEAAEHYKRALRALEMQASPDESRRCEVLLALGRVELRQGDPESRLTFEQAADLARRQGLPEHLGHAALGFASRYTEAGVVDDPGIAMLREALDQLGEEPSALRAELIARLADSLHFAPEHEETIPLSHTAMVLAREVDDTHALVAALVSRHAALLHIAHLDERLALSQELLDLAERVGERELEALGHHWRIYDLLEAAEVEAARAEHRALAKLAKELRQPLYDHLTVGWDVVWANMAGRIKEAERFAEESYELGKRAQARDAETVYWAQVVALRRREHRLSDFVSTVQSAAEQHPALMAWRAVLPLAHLAAGKTKEAVEEFEWLAHDDFSRVPRDMFWFTCVCVLAETCALIRDTARASVLYEMLLPYKDRNVQVTRAACWGSCERFLGLLAAAGTQWEAASGHYEEAIAKNTAGGLPGGVSLVQRDYAEMLVARRADGDLDRARDLFRENLRAAEAAGMRQLTAYILTRIQAIERERLADANPPALLDQPKRRS